MFRGCSFIGIVFLRLALQSDCSFRFFQAVRKLEQFLIRTFFFVQKLFVVNQFFVVVVVVMIIEISVTQTNVFRNQNSSTWFTSAAFENSTLVANRPLDPVMI
jgi:hypothetical protein